MWTSSTGRLSRPPRGGWQQHAVALLTLTLLAAAPASAAPNPKAEELKDAINADYKFSRTNWDSAVMNDTLSKWVWAWVSPGVPWRWAPVLPRQHHPHNCVPVI